MSHQPVGIRSLAVSFPRTVRTNDYWRQNHPELIAQAEQKSLSKAFSIAASTQDSKANLWSQEMLPYLSDPFRGTVERRVLAPGESSLDIEYQAAKEALDAAKLDASDVDLIILASMFPEKIIPGNAVFLAGKLEIQSPAWNIESMCAGGLVAFQTACALVRSGEYRNILIVASCSYSRYFDDRDTLSFFAGDGAAAFIVSSLKTNQGILGTKIVNSFETCETFFNELVIDSQNNPRMFIKASKDASKTIPHTVEKFIRPCCEGAAALAGVTLDEIDFFVFNTPTAWYANFCACVLGIDPERTINIYPQYGNIGVVLPLAALYHAAQSGKIQEDSLVLVYNRGYSANVVAVVMRWGDVALGSTPATTDNSTKAMVGAPG
jgi:3-oxoacyl-[acyl-carrier-protein] synthase-3